jgi:glycosyltransferase involved in cell wall biosynthesis
LPGDALIVGAIGRPRPVKGYDYLLAAWPQVVAANPHARLLFIGDGPDRPKLQRQAAQLGVTEQVIFWGDQAHIAALLPILDVLVVSSLFEGAGIVLMEAMAASLPVVSTAVGGTPEIVRHEETGLLVPARNSDALAAGILQLLADPDARERYGRAGRQRVEQAFDLRLNVAHTERLYEQLIRARFGDSLAPVREAK